MKQTSKQKNQHFLWQDEKLKHREPPLLSQSTSVLFSRGDESDLSGKVAVVRVEGQFNLAAQETCLAFPDAWVSLEQAKSTLWSE